MRRSLKDVAAALPRAAVVSAGVRCFGSVFAGASASLEDLFGQGLLFFGFLRGGIGRRSERWYPSGVCRPWHYR